MYSIGIDSGSVATKGVLFDGKKIVKKVVIPTGWSPKESSKQVYSLLIDGVEKGTIKKIVGTGYGRVTMDFIDKKVTEITCHSKGIYFINSKIRTILDVGGQDSKVISLDENGNVSNFFMNDKCAAGTGRFLEVTSNLLGTDINNLDIMAKGKSPIKISNMCTVFAESEIVSLLAQNIDKERIAAGILKSIAEKSSAMLSKVNILEEIAFTGGLANSIELVKMIENNIGKNIYVDTDSQIIGALGAAVIGFN